MATTINAATTGLVETSDGTAVLALQTGGTTAVTINATQALGVGSSPSYGTAGQFLTSGGSGAAPTWTTGGTGTVTSVGWTGGIVSVATATTTPAFTIAGTSGGIVYFNSASTWASSAALTQYGIVYGGGAGGAPVATAVGTTGQFLGANTGGAPTWQTPAGGGSAATPTALGTVYASMTTSGGSPYLTALGYNAGLNSNGNGNTAIGVDALKTSGVSKSTAIGYQALSAVSSYDSNTAVGYQAMSAANPLYGTCTAVGYQALQNTTGDNTAFGYQAGNGVTSGSGNTIIGHLAGFSGTALTTGSTNAYIGYAAKASAAAINNEMVVCCGSGGGTGKGTSTGFINPNGGGVYQGNNATAWSQTSDRRLKKNIVDNNVGLDAIKSIQVRNFEYRLPEEVEELDANCAIDKKGVQLGVIAQELQAFLPDCVKQESTGVMGLQSDNLTWYMVNAIKQLSAALDAANARIAALEAK
jgi:hypothetical protein